MTHTPEYVPGNAENPRETLRAFAAKEPYTAPERIKGHGLYETVRREWLEAVDEVGVSVERYLAGLPETLREESRLLALWLHHPDTCFHALRTARLEQFVLTNAPELAEAIVNEGVSVEDNVRAALLHDDGKRAIPEVVLSARPTDADCLTLLEHLFNIQDPETLAILARAGLEGTSWQTLQERTRDENPRPVRLLPIRALIDQDALALLLERGFAVHGKTLLDIINEHERFTREYLADRPALAAIAGHHHSVEESPYPISSETLGHHSRLAQELLHVLDIVEAVSAQREYKPGRPLVCALLAELREEQRAHRVSNFVLYHVVQTLMESLSAKNECASGDRLCGEACVALTDFLREHASDAVLRESE